MFNKELFAKLLQEARGENSMSRFAVKADISPAHLSRLSRCQLKTPPTPELLKRLAAVADNGVTLELFMDACGYYEEPEKAKDERRDEVIQTVFRFGRGWSIKKGENIDYILTHEDGRVWEWKEGGRVEETYGSLAVLQPGEKRSIVVRNKVEADSFMKKPPISLLGNYSLVMIEEKGWKEIFFKK